ncbi:MAG: 4Fe-4S dicluster domain-containing protein, partial [Thermodesulfobacteriota bacterium]
CLTAVKNAVLIKERDPGAWVEVLYRDLMMSGTRNEELLWRARGLGVRFGVYDVAAPPVVEDGRVRFRQALTGEEREIPCDLVVLSTPLVAPGETPELARLLRVPVDGHGFFLEAHVKLRPLDFAADGLFVCGSAHWPATSAEARALGLGAAARAATVLFKDKLVLSAVVSEIDPRTCLGCRSCLAVCPFGAISYLPEERVCRVNEVICKGCGSCAAACPSRSARLRGFTPEQICAQIRAV